MKRRDTITWSVILTFLLIVFVGGYYATRDTIAKNGCNTIQLGVHGELLTSDSFYDYESAFQSSLSTDIISYLDEAQDDERIKAVLLEIDSSGGMPVAAEEVANAFLRFDKPSVAVVRAAGTSAAYWAATGVDKIYASRNSDVGGIGVTISLINQVAENEEEGRSYISITSAPFKTIGDPNRTLTEEERRLLQEDVDAIHANFVDAVVENRGLAREHVEALANGDTMLGTQALEAGLIDEIGDTHAAEQYLAEKIGTEVRYCTEEDLMW